MGCTSSKQGEDRAGPQSFEMLNTNRNQRLTPRQQRDPQSRMPIRPQEYALDRNTLTQAMNLVAQFMARNGRNITLVTVGGAVNTVLLGTRETTHDVDFFNSLLQPSEVSLISQAGRYAQAKIPASLGGNWLNNTTTLLMSREMVDKLTRQAETQNEVVFQASGLRVLAAPWKYAFCTKLDRMGKPQKRSYDENDAAEYLHRHIRRNGGRPVRVDEIRAWGQEYGTKIGLADLQRVAALYEQAHRRQGIIF